MSKVSDLSYDIEQLYIEGKSAKAIARELNCPKHIVDDWIKEMNVGEDAQYDPYETVNS